MKPTLVVLAAGMGSRYGGLKQIDPIGPNGELLIEYSIFDALRSGFEKIVFVIRQEMEEDFRSIIGKRISSSVQIQYAFQSLEDIPEGFSVPADRKKQWGTGHAVFACRSLVNEPFGVINADDYYGRDSFKLLANFLTTCDSQQTNYCAIPFILNNTLSENGPVSRGLCKIDNHGILQCVTELHGLERDGSQVAYQNNGKLAWLTGQELVSMNMWGFTPALFDQLGHELIGFLGTVLSSMGSSQVSLSPENQKAEFYLPSAIDSLIKRSIASVRCLASPEQWFGVTHPQDKEMVMRRITSLVTYPGNLWNQAEAQ